MDTARVIARAAPVSRRETDENSTALARHRYATGNLQISRLEMTSRPRSAGVLDPAVKETAMTILSNVAATTRAFRHGPSRLRPAILLTILSVWRRRRETRRVLTRFDDHLLRDIGITPGEAEREIAKPFWRA
jgi:uncharacterized protein YjiS (DUF1127 family)